MFQPTAFPSWFADSDHSIQRRGPTARRRAESLDGSDRSAIIDPGCLDDPDLVSKPLTLPPTGSDVVLMARLLGLLEQNLPHHTDVCDLDEELLRSPRAM